MHKLYTAITFIFFISNAFCQKDFEGIIHYDLSFKDKTGEMTAEQSLQFMGTKQTYYIKGNKYKSEMNGLLKLTQYYTGRDTLYNKMEGFNGLLYIDSKSNSEKIISSKIEDNNDKIGNYDCKVLDIKTDKGIIKYYFNDKIKVNPDLYKEHNYGLWYFCLEETDGALPLKMLSDDKDGLLVITINDIINKKLSEEIFIIPKGMPIMKSPN